MLGDFPMVAVPSRASEVALIESFADTRVIGITVNHEGMADADVIGKAIDEIELDLGLPATDPLTRPLDQLAAMVLDAFPALREPRCPQRDDRTPPRGRPRRDRGTTPAHWWTGSPARASESLA